MKEGIFFVFYFKKMIDVLVAQCWQALCELSTKSVDKSVENLGNGALNEGKAGGFADNVQNFITFLKPWF